MAGSPTEGASETYQNRRDRRLHPLILLSLLVILALFSGCQIAQSAFARTASNAGAAFAAAAQTIQDEQVGKLTKAYAQSSFVSYQSELQGLDQRLPTQSGAPNAKALRTLLRLSAPALAAVAHPCLDSACNWRAQVAALDHASAALLKASGS